MTQVQFNTALLNLKSKLHYYALSLTADREKADDLLQETMLKALTYRDKYIPNTNFKAWIYTIMKNTFINDYRRSVKTRNTFDKSGNDLHLMFTKDEGYPAPDSYYSTKEIHSSINKLEDDYKIPFTLFLEGYKYKEIAAKMELPLGTVKSRIFFTRRKLEKMLHEFRRN